MRTDTVSFRKRAFQALRSHGVSSAKAAQAVAHLDHELARLGYPRVEDSAEVVVSMDAADSQTVAVVIGGLVVAHVCTWRLRELQPLVNTEPTARQVEIAEQLSALIPEIYSAMQEGQELFVSRHGEPRDEIEHQAKHAFVTMYEPYRSVLAQYDRLKAESLMINPNVDGAVVDPDKASHWYQWVRDARGYRPTGFMTIKMIEADMKSVPDEIAEAA